MWNLWVLAGVLGAASAAPPRAVAADLEWIVSRCELVHPGDHAQSCNRGRGEACLRTACAYASGRGVAADLSRAATFFEKACEQNEPAGCSDLGQMTSLGLGVPSDPDAAKTLLEKGCRAGDARGCTILGSMAVSDRDFSMAIELFDKACDGRDGPACIELGEFAEQGTGLFTPDLERAEEAYRDAARVSQLDCDRGDRAACVDLGYLYESSNGVIKDSIRAAKLYEAGCAAGVVYGCARLGRLYLVGRGVIEDADHAALLFEKACSGGVADACLLLGTLAETRDRPVFARIAKVLRRACNHDVAAACHRLALLVHDGGAALTDPNQARSLLLKACTLGDSGACAENGTGHSADP
jgi:uncharacterized protein